MFASFRAREDPGAAGIAAYLSILHGRSPDVFLGGLLSVNAIAEPLELVRIRLRAGESARCGERLTADAAARLVARVLEATHTTPDVLFVDAGGIHAATFEERIALAVPAIRLSADDTDTADLWLAGEVAAASPRAADVVRSLAGVGVLFEPLVRLGEALRLPFDNAEAIR